MLWNDKIQQIKINCLWKVGYGGGGDDMNDAHRLDRIQLSWSWHTIHAIRVRFVRKIRSKVCAGRRPPLRLLVGRK